MGRFREEPTRRCKLAGETVNATGASAFSLGDLLQSIQLLCLSYTY